MKKVMVIIGMVFLSANYAFAGNATTRLSAKQVVTEGLTAPSGVGAIVISTKVTSAYDVLVGSISGNGAGLTALPAGQLTGSLPAIDGSSLTGVIHATTTYSADGVSLKESAGVFSADSSSVTLRGNTFNGNNQLVLLNGSGGLPAISGANLTNLPEVTKHSFIHGYTYTEADVWADSTTVTGAKSMLKCTVTVKESPAGGSGDTVRCGNDTEYIDVSVPDATARGVAIAAAGPIAIGAGRGIAFKVTATGTYSGMYGCQLELAE